MAFPVDVSFTVYANTIDGLQAAGVTQAAAVKPSGWTTSNLRQAGPAVPVGPTKAEPGDPTPVISEWAAQIRCTFNPP
jgi:hypothetical protein